MKTRALKIATIVALVVGAQAVFADGGQTDDDSNSVIKSLRRSKDAEGGYDWKLGGEAARIWVVCQSETRVWLYGCRGDRQTATKTCFMRQTVLMTILRARTRSRK